MTNLKGENNSNWKGGKIKKECEICKESFESYSHQNKKFCSLNCKHINQSRIMTGNKITNMTEEKKRIISNKLIARNKDITGEYSKTKLIKKIRQLARYYQWKQDILIRDKNKCIECGSEKELCIDHFPKGISQIIFENKIKTISDAILCKDLWSTLNGRVLCKKCHKITDNYGRYGTIENISKLFSEKYIKPKLNLGSGRDIKVGYINLDTIPWDGLDLIWDMTKGLPFNDNYFFEIISNYSLTQIGDTKDFMWVLNECWRTLKTQGTFKIKVPNVKHPLTSSFNDPFDCRYFTEETFDYFDINHKYRWKAFNYGFKPWEIIKIEKIGENNSRLYIEMSPSKL